MHSRVNWGAIFAGAFISVAAMVFFSLFALASGINGINAIQPLGTSITVPAAFYTILTAMVSFALGGYCTTILARLRDPGQACLHALAGFSVAGAMVPFLFTRTFFVGSPGFAITPPPGAFLSLGMAWTLFFAFGLACVAATAAGVQACYRVKGVMRVDGEVFETDRQRTAA